MRFALLTLALLLSYQCSSVSKGTPANSSVTDSEILNQALQQKQTKSKIEALLRNRYRSPGQDAELSVLKRGGTQREAELARRKYDKGLSDMELDELKYLEQGKSEREALLRAKDDNKKINPLENRELMQIKYGTGTPTSASSESSIPDQEHK